MKIMYALALGLLCSSHISWNMQFGLGAEVEREKIKISQNGWEWNKEKSAWVPMQNNDRETEWYSPDPITARSFTTNGKILLMKYVQNMQLASKKSGYTNGLAAICNAIPATFDDMTALTQEPDALYYANIYNKKLASTEYPNLKSLFFDIKNIKSDLAIDCQHALASMLIYNAITKTSDIRMPEERMGMAFMGTDIDTNIRVLKENNHIDPSKNAPYAKGAAMLMAYCTQKFMDQ